MWFVFLGRAKPSLESSGEVAPRTGLNFREVTFKAEHLFDLPETSNWKLLICCCSFL